MSRLIELFFAHSLLSVLTFSGFLVTPENRARSVTGAKFLWLLVSDKFGFGQTLRNQLKVAGKTTGPCQPIAIIVLCVVTCQVAWDAVKLLRKSAPDCWHLLLLLQFTFRTQIDPAIEGFRMCDMYLESHLKPHDHMQHTLQSAGLPQRHGCEAKGERGSWLGTVTPEFLGDMLNEHFSHPFLENCLHDPPLCAPSPTQREEIALVRFDDACFCVHCHCGVQS